MPVSTHIQHVSIIEWLLVTSLTSIQLKERNILSFAARINELRNCGFHIVTVDTDYIDSNGEHHIIGRYVLLLDRSDLNNRGLKILEKAMAA